MQHIISDISNPVNLKQYIDNRDGFKRVGLKSFTYCCGWHNIQNEVIQKQGEAPVRIQPGYYSFQQMADIFRSHKICLSVNETSGKDTLSTPSELKVSKRLKSMLGFQVKGRFFQSKLIKVKGAGFCCYKIFVCSFCQILMNHTINIMAPRAMYWLPFPLGINALVIL